MKSKAFTLNEVHVHYDCHCSHEALIELKENDSKVGITVKNRCRTHKQGRSIELIIGGKMCEATPCPHPGCNCDSMTMHLPMDDFLAFLNTPCDEDEACSLKRPKAAQNGPPPKHQRRTSTN